MHENSTTPQQAQSTDLEWLLNNLLNVPGVTGALLAAQDGLKLAYTRRPSEFADKGFDTETADRVASVISGVYALTHGVADLSGGTGRDLQLCLFKHKDWSLFVVSAGKGVPEGTPLGLGARPSEVESTLGVMTTPHVDEAVVGYEMKQLVRSMRRHLQTPIRRPEHAPADGQ
jgi:predicted regulator of Ras-like GTPase activity (Roadblock/LC7/MglB family)